MEFGWEGTREGGKEEDISEISLTPLAPSLPPSSSFAPSCVTAFPPPPPSPPSLSSFLAPPPPRRLNEEDGGRAQSISAPSSPSLRR